METNVRHQTIAKTLMAFAFVMSPTVGALAQKRAAASVQLYSYITDSSERSKGLYTFNTSNPSAMTLISDDINIYGGAAYAQGTLWANFFTENESGSQITFPIKLYGYNTADWSQTDEKRGFTFNSIANDLAFDPETQALYGIFSDSEYSGHYMTLGRVKYENNPEYPYTIYDCDPIAQMPEDMVAITFDRNGKLYTISRKGNFYAVDKFTGEYKLVGNTGYSVVPFFQSATCDYTTGKIYWAAYTADDWATHILQVDPTTAATQDLVNFGYDESTGKGESTDDQIATLFMKQDLELNALPKQVENLDVALSSLTAGTASFTMPTADAAGTPLLGNLGYTVRIDGYAAATGSAAPGAAVKAPFTARKSGSSTFAVTAERAATADRPAAIGEPLKKTVWVGYDVPNPPTRVRAKAKGSDVSLSWTSPTKAVNGGYFDKKNLKYELSRFAKGNDADSTIVAQALGDTVFVDHIQSPDMATYYYRVRAVNGDMKSDAAESVEVSVGSCVSLPYTNALDSYDKIEDFTIVDANNDNMSWGFDSNYNMVSYGASSENAADDWLIAPPINMKKGSAYKFAFDAVNDYPTERVAASVGSQPTAEAMTDEVIAPTNVTYMPRRRTLTGTYRAKEDGMKYFGIHAVSDADCNHLYVDNLKISEIASTAPDAPTSLTVVPGDKGASTAQLSFVAPRQTLAGDALTGNLSIVVYRNGESVTTLTNVAPGESCSYSDENVPSGKCLYAVVAVDNGEEGLEASKQVFVGNDEPGEVRNLRAYEDAEEEGLIHVEWDAPLGLNGGYVDPDDLTYYISVGTSSDDINLGHRNSYEDQLVITDGRQAYNGYSVYAVSSTGGSRQNWKTCMAIGGPSLKMPMVESFKNVTMKSGPWITNVTQGEVGEAYCYCMTNSSTTNAQDGDGGMQSFSAEAAGKAVRSESPKVDISGAQHPVLHFWAFCNGKDGKMRVSVQKDYGEFEPVMEISGDKYELGWHRFTVDLTPYKNSRYVRVGFEAEADSTLQDFMGYDNVSIADQVDHDLMAMDLNAVENVETGDEAALSLVVRNNTDNRVEGKDYSVVLYKNGREAARVNGRSVDADMTTEIAIDNKVSTIDDDVLTYYAKIEYDADQVPDNNTSAEKTVKVKKPDFPAPQKLEASSRENNVVLTWKAPDNSVRYKTTTDSFEDYDKFIIDGIGDWTVYDCDKQNTIRITLNQEFGPLNYDNAGEPMAFQVFNTGEAGIPFASWDPHSGEQMLVAFSCASADGGFTKEQNDDWIVSPELNGKVQTIRFYAKAGMASAVPEQMEVLYSASDKSIANFKKVGSTIDVNNAKGWDEYSFDVPEGAKYFAIRCVSNDKFALLVDDISYVAKDAVEDDLQLLGYNVYRDMKKLNAKLIDKRYYVDDNVEQKVDYKYLVTAVYDRGESRPSNLAAVTFVSGVGDIQSNEAVVAGGNGVISVVGADGKLVRVVAVGGQLVARFVAQGNESVAVAPGVYVVTVAGKTFKVMVK